MARTMPRRALRTPPRTTRAKPPVSYAESSSDEGDYEDIDADVSHPPVASPRNKTRARSTSTKRQRHSRNASSSSSQILYENTPKRRRLASAKATTPATPEVIAYSGVIPAWQSLPYQVLVQVFRYASYPLYDEHTFQPLPSNRWLLNISRLCRSFSEPALTVLYSSPPLVPMNKAHGLVDLLKANPRPMTYKYRQKIESLRVDVGQVAAYSMPGSGLLDLYEMIKNLPRLLDLEFYHQKDMPPYRNLDDTIKWTYPESLLDALEYVDPAADPTWGDKTSIIKLRSWRWSSRLAGKLWPIETVGEVHMKPSFATLRKVAFVNYQVRSARKGEDDPKLEKVLADSISVLPNLEHLIFDSSTLVNPKLLPLLPTNLRHLELIDCWEVVADDFRDFLLTHGNQLRSLTLNHNQSLSLSFLPSLGIACPQLEVLKMNLTYFNLHATYHDSEPQYEKLLVPGELPTWPSTIQTIELIQLRKWETEAAEMFFQSLLDSAGELPNLRRLVIQAILNIGWRDRASFRDKWVGSLERVFRRMSEDPKPVSSRIEDTARESFATSESNGQSATNAGKLRSIFGTNLSSTTFTPDSNNTEHEGPSLPSRRSTRHNKKPGQYAESPSTSSDEAPLSRRAARELSVLKATPGMSSAPHPPSLQESDDSDDEPHLGGTPKDKGKGKQKAKEVVQGMCEVVDIRIDNLRPRETQATEADFLDDEPEDDPDWDENEGEDDGGGYAW